MKCFCLFTLCLTSLAAALTPDEFKALYEHPDKDAAACYALHKAYLEGDGVEKDIYKSQKWLLGAYEMGMTSVRGELGAHPVREAMKLPTKLKTAKVSDEVAQAKGEELVELLQVMEGIGGGAVREKEPASASVMKAVRKLLNAGADPNVFKKRSGMQRWTALACAADIGDQKLMKLLIDAGADPAAHGHHAPMAIYLVEGFHQRNGKNGKARGKQLDATINTLSRYMNVKAHTKDGWSPLYAAVIRHSESAVRALLAAGADPDMRQNKFEISGPIDKKAYFYQIGFMDRQWNSLHLAANSDRPNLTRILLEAGADPRLTDANGLDAMKVLDDSKKRGNQCDHEAETRQSIQDALDGKFDSPKSDSKSKKAKKSKKGRMKK